MYNFDGLCQYTVHRWLLYQVVIMLFYSAIFHFYLFYDGRVHMQLRVLLTRSQCRVPDTHVTVKAYGPLV